MMCCLNGVLTINRNQVNGREWGEKRRKEGDCGNAHPVTELDPGCRGAGV